MKVDTWSCWPRADLCSRKANVSLRYCFEPYSSFQTYVFNFSFTQTVDLKSVKKVDTLRSNPSNFTNTPPASDGFKVEIEKVSETSCKVFILKPFVLALL